MSLIEELDWQFKTGESGVMTHKNADAVASNIREWCATPQGTVADWPSWGNNFHQLKFLPQREFVSVAESLIMRKMQQDIWHLQIRGIRLEVEEVDLFRIYVDYGFDLFTDQITGENYQ
jgi:hypothetical protein